MERNLGFRLYRYVGPKQISDRILHQPKGTPIRSPEDVRVWMRDTLQHLDNGCVIATFVIDSAGVLLLADRRSEHVACADGHPVRSAGEITFTIGRDIEVVEVSNQSTGFCPEPEPWPAVAAALSSAGIACPNQFSMTCVFRRCVSCNNLTLIKDEVFECGACGSSLPANYNVQGA